MSRPFAAVLGITLGLPVLAMIAITATGGIKPDFLMTFLVGGVLMVFVVGAIFEIKRLVDLDSHENSEQAEFIPTEKLADPKVYNSAPAHVTAASDSATEIRVPDGLANTTEILIPNGPAAAVEGVTSAEVEPVVVEGEVSPVVATGKRKAGRRKAVSAA